MRHIVIAEQQELLRMGLQYSLESLIADINSKPSDFSELTTLLNENQCDVLLIDHSILYDPKHESLHVLKELNTKMKIIVTTTKDCFFNFYLLLQQGLIDGLCLKSDDIDIFHQAINVVLDGKCFISETLSTKLERRENKLTPKELQVIELLVLGLNNKEVAHTLNNSERTINVHRSNIMHKLNLSNVVELINYAYQNGMSKLNFCY